MKKLPIEQHKKRVLVFIEPKVIEDLTIETCQTIAKENIAKEHKRYLKAKKNGKP